MEIESFEIEGIDDYWFIVQVSDTTMMPWKLLLAKRKSLAECAEKRNKKHLPRLQRFPREALSAKEILLAEGAESAERKRKHFIFFLRLQCFPGDHLFFPILR
jgi:hypothetical protein